MSERYQYIEENLDTLLDTDPNAFLRTAAARITLAASDIYGASSSVLERFADILSGKDIDPESVGSSVDVETVQLVSSRQSVRLAKQIAFELFQICSQNYEYFDEFNLTNFWTCLQNAGMKDEQIGRYFEAYVPVSRSE